MGNKLRSSGKYKTEPIKYASKIEDKATWNALEHQPTDRVFAHCGVVKFVIDLTSNPEKPTPYFLQSKTFTYHYEFVQGELGMKVDLGTFNDEQYMKWPRKFILGTIVHYEDQGIYAFEIWPGDNMPAEGIVKAWKLLEAAITQAKPLRFRACSASHEARLRTALQDPSISADYRADLDRLLNLYMVKSEDLFKAVVYQPLTTGVTVGYIRILKGVNEDPQVLMGLNREDILVTDQIPNDLPYVRGLVTSDLQTPLCHVALLCANRRAPNIAVRNALKEFEPYEGKLVKITVTMLEYKCELAKANDLNAWLESPQGKRSIKATLGEADITLKTNDSITELVYLSKLESMNEIEHYEPAIGAKATQIAKMNRLKLPGKCKLVMEPAFVIPFSHYLAYLDKVIEVEKDEKQPLQKLIQNSKTMPTRELSNALGKVQENLIETHYFDQALLDSIMKALAEGMKPGGWLDGTGGAIFRSSTNVEDLPGFNGAGLYLSETVKYADLTHPDIVAETIKRVWASVWTARGFMERSEFGIKQNNVRMAILVMPFLGKDQVICNGVAVTGNPYRSSYPAQFYNVQIAGTAVTDNCQGKTPEQILVYDDEVPAPETITPSSMTGGNPILNDSEIIHSLFPTFNELHKKFAIKRKEENSQHAVDIEFLLLNNSARDLVILQCRPCTIAYQS